MNTTDLLNWAKDKTLHAGASDVALTLSEQTNRKIDIRDGEIEKTKSGQSRGLSIQVYMDGRYSQHRTNKLDQPSLEKFISNAVEATRFLQEDEFRKITPSALFPTELNELRTYDPKSETLMPEQMLDQAKLIHEATLSEGVDLISSKSTMSVTQSETHKLLSNGFYGVQKGSMFSQTAEVTLQGSGDRRAEEYAAVSSRFLATLPDSRHVGTEATARAKEKVGETKIETGNYQLIVENRVSSRFISILLSAMSAAALAHRQSFLDGKLGERITSEHLSITDRPNLIGGFGSKNYDEEAVACRTRDLIRDGKLTNYLVDTYYGRKLDMTPNGAQTTNLLFSGNTQPVSEILSSAPKGIWVKAFNGGNSNPVTGDFSYGISGLLIENGNVTRPVSEMVITGNVLDLFERLVSLGDDPYPFASMQRPTLVFDGVSCSGK